MVARPVAMLFAILLGFLFACIRLYLLLHWLKLYILNNAIVCSYDVVGRLIAVTISIALAP